MPHIHTGPGQHDHTASAFIVRTDLDEPKVVLHIHKKLGKLMQPGGHVELHETPWQAVLHEIAEETGYNPSQLKVLQPQHRIKSLTGAKLHPSNVCQLTHRFKAGMDHYHTDTTYAFVASCEPKSVIAEGESTDIRLLSLSDLQLLSEDSIYSNIKELAEFVLGTCVPEWEAVDLKEFEL